MLKIGYDRGYYIYLENLLEEQPELLDEIETRVRWFINNPDDTRIRNHELEKKLKGKWAFSITGDERIVYKWIGKNEVGFLRIGPHPVVYKS